MLRALTANTSANVTFMEGAWGANGTHSAPNDAIDDNTTGYIAETNTTQDEPAIET